MLLYTRTQLAFLITHNAVAIVNHLFTISRASQDSTTKISNNYFGIHVFIVLQRFAYTYETCMHFDSQGQSWDIWNLTFSIEYFDLAVMKLWLLHMAMPSCKKTLRSHNDCQSLDDLPWSKKSDHTPSKIVTNPNVSVPENGQTSTNRQPVLYIYTSHIVHSHENGSTSFAKNWKIKLHKNIFIIHILLLHISKFLDQ